MGSCITGEAKVEFQLRDLTIPCTSPDAIADLEAGRLGIDASLLFGMERTLYSGMQLGLQVIIFGIGLMMVGVKHSKSEELLGLITAFGGLLFVAGCWVTHCMRTWLLTHDRQVTARWSIISSTTITIMLLFVISVELYYGWAYPYLERSFPVDVNNPSGI